jgi:hypothetical protein
MESPMERIICHWTAGGHKATALDREHYHYIFEGDGAEVRGDRPVEANREPMRGNYAAHTLNCNSGSIGLAVACMRGAVEGKTHGPSPMTRAQWDAMVARAAALCRQYSIPVTPRTVLTHAEVQGNLGIRQRGKWDIAVLPFEPSVRGARAVGERLRAEVRAAMGDASPAALADLGGIETRLRARGSRTIAAADAIGRGATLGAAWNFVAGGGLLSALPYLGDLHPAAQLLLVAAGLAIVVALGLAWFQRRAAAAVIAARVDDAATGRNMSRLEDAAARRA